MKTTIRILQNLQRLALLCLGFFRPSTPTAGLEVITHTIPLWLHVRQEATMAYLRTKNQELLPRATLYVEDRPHTVGHRQIVSAFIEEIGYDIKETDNLTIPTQNWNQKYRINKEEFEKGEPKEDADIVIYTDGSKNLHITLLPV